MIAEHSATSGTAMSQTAPQVGRRSVEQQVRAMQPQQQVQEQPTIMQW